MNEDAKLVVASALARFGGRWTCLYDVVRACPFGLSVSEISNAIHGLSEASVAETRIDGGVKEWRIAPAQGDSK